jgi:hypothetical protein
MTAPDRDDFMEFKPRFPMGTLSATAGARRALWLSREAAGTFLVRHVTGGAMHDRNPDATDQAEGLRVLSVHRTLMGVVLWIITEADRSRTRILLPEEYDECR